MEREKLLEAILDSILYRIVFVDCDLNIRYMNKEAKHYYYGVRGYRELEGHSIMKCHRKESSNMLMRNMIRHFEEEHAEEVFIGMSPQDERRYMSPVRNREGEVIGFFGRFEKNLAVTSFLEGG